MTIIRKILYKPYLLFFIFFGSWFIYYAFNNPWGMTLNAIFIYAIYFYLIKYVFPFLQNPLLKLASLISVFDTVPNKVISGYFFILVLMYPLPMVFLAIFSKLFIKEKIYHSSFTDDYGNKVTHINSLTPTVFFTRRNGQEDEHIVVTKLKKKPKKVTYE